MAVESRYNLRSRRRMVELPKSPQSESAELIDKLELISIKAKIEKVDKIDWDSIPLDCNSEEWSRALKTCPICEKSHPHGAAAAACVIAHNRLRCYLCLKPYRNCGELFHHFNEVHRLFSLRKGIIVCPFCPPRLSESLPFKSVTCHIITHHLAAIFYKKEDAPSVEIAPTSAGTASVPIESDFRTPDWYIALRTCQYCKKKHSNPAEASKCITSHQKLRCYFCLSYHRNTEELHHHFYDVHRHWTEATGSKLNCPFCSKYIAFKSVSCHVISEHIYDDEQ